MLLRYSSFGYHEFQRLITCIIDCSSKCSHFHSRPIHREDRRPGLPHAHPIKNSQSTPLRRLDSSILYSWNCQRHHCISRVSFILRLLLEHCRKHRLLPWRGSQMASHDSIGHYLRSYSARPSRPSRVVSTDATEA